MNLWTTTLRAFPRGADVVAALQAALAAIEPAAVVRQAMRRSGERLEVAGQLYDLHAVGDVWLAAVGKAALPMARAAAEVLGDRLAGGVVLTKAGHGGDVPARLQLYEAGHPLPDARGLQATRALVEVLARAGPADLVVLLISGGGSALCTLPAEPLALADLQAITGLLLGCGATIHELNAVRKHLDTVKGGGLVRLAGPARLAAVLLSDVVGSPLDVIASGPTVPDPTTYADALAVLERYDLLARAPPAVLARLQAGAAGALPETLKPGDARLERVQTSVVADLRRAACAAAGALQAAGWHVQVLTTRMQGEAREIGRLAAALAIDLADGPRPACLILGGETTVTLRGTGHGGRNQELALAAALDLAGVAGVLVLTLATDGGDGPTDAAGAVADGATVARARAAGLDAQAHLARNDAYPLFATLGDLLMPGPTRTNVNDLVLICAA